MMDDVNNPKFNATSELSNDRKTLTALLTLVVISGQRVNGIASVINKNLWRQ